MNFTIKTKEIALNATVAVLAVIASLSIATTTLYANGDREEGRWYKGFGFKTPGMQPADPLYQKECGSCHFAYQPGLLPVRSWERVMETLADHFGADATLEAADAQAITAYLKNYAADSGRAGYKHYQKLNRSIAPGTVVTRITRLPYFVHEHREIPQRLIDQKEVKSLSHCQTCHTTADQGVYGERGIVIPGYGRWDE